MSISGNDTGPPTLKLSPGAAPRCNSAFVTAEPGDVEAVVAAGRSEEDAAAGE